MKPTKNLRIPTLALLLAAFLTPAAWASRTVLTEGHIDLGAAWEAGGYLALEVHDEETDTVYEPDEAAVLYGTEIRGQRPAGAAFDFLGAEGSYLWISPGSEVPGVPYLGLSAAEVPPGLFVDDRLELTLLSVVYSGPGSGRFFLYTEDDFGAPSLWFDSGDLTNHGTYVMTVGQHAHVHWAFTEEGIYDLTLAVSGTKVPAEGGGAVSSLPATLQLQVVPEPGVVSLLSVGLAGLLLRHRHRAVQARRLSGG